MSPQANPFKVGSFVLAGLALVVAVLLVLGSGRLFTPNVRFVLYFADSVNGLTVGSPVKFKGVPIGSVKRIQLSLDQRGVRQYIPVVVEVNQEQIRSAQGEIVDIRNPAFIAEQIQKGLRASLELESFITGRLYVQFDYYTNAPKAEFQDQATHYQEIPTIATGLTEFLKSLERLDLPGLSQKINAALDQVTGMLTNIPFREISRRLTNTLATVEHFIQSPELQQAVQSVKQTSDEARRLLGDVRAEVKPVAAGVTNTVAQAAQTLAELRARLEELRHVMDADSPLLGEITRTLAEFSDAARAVRLLSEYLARNPRAVLTGRPSPTPQP